MGMMVWNGGGAGWVCVDGVVWDWVWWCGWVGDWGSAGCGVGGWGVWDGGGEGLWWQVGAVERIVKSEYGWCVVRNVVGKVCVEWCGGCEWVRANCVVGGLGGR